MIWKVAHFHRAIVILAACLTLRVHGTHVDLLRFLYLHGLKDFPSNSRAFSVTSVFEA